MKTNIPEVEAGKFPEKPGLFKPVPPAGQQGKPRLAIRGLGDVVEAIAKPIARVFKLDCLDEQGNLKPETPCARRKAALNKAVPFT